MGSERQRLEIDRDDEVHRRVVEVLATKHFPVFRAIDIDVDQNVVTMSGSLGSFYEKQVALTACQQVAGVRQIVDCLDVACEPREALLS